MKDEIKEYRILYMEGIAIKDNGTRLGTLEMLETDFPDNRWVVMRIDKVPSNWRDMVVENRQLIPAPKEIMKIRKQTENARKTEALRIERDGKLAETDKCMSSDFPISEEEREQYRAYRQYLRDLPEADGFPDVPVMTFGEFAGTE